MKQEVKIGQTDYTVLILVRDSTTGAPKTALTFESEGIDVCYTRVETDNDVVLTDGAPVTTTLTGDHVDWGFVLVDDTKAPGLYKLDIADGVFASGAWSAVVSFICTGCDPVHIEFVLVPEAPADGVKINSIADDKITAASINTAALTADAFAADAIVASTLATGALTADAFAADAIVAATLATGAITADAFAADAIVAATLNTGCITADAFAANAITAATLASDCIEAAKIKDGAITNAKVADDVDVNVKTITANAITATAINADAITADKIADNAFANEHFAAGALDAVWSTAARTLTAIDEDNTTLDLDATIEAILAASATIAALPTAAENADAVWDEVVTSGQHDTATYAGAGLLAAASAGDPWSTALPGAYGAGTAGKALSDVLADTNELQGNQGDWATATGFSTHSAADVAALVLVTPAQKLVTDANGYVTYSNSAPPAASAIADAVWDEAIGDHGGAGATGKAVADILADTNELQGDDYPTSIAAVKTVVDAVKVQTDKLTFTVANQVDANIQYVNDVALTGDGSATPWGPV